MKFPYRKLLLRDRMTGEIDLVLRPEAPITIHGQSCSMTCTGLVDSGSDTTVIPASLGRELGVTLMPSRRQGTGFGGQVLDFFTGEIELEIPMDESPVRWRATVNFAEFATESQETIILGQAGFLEYFRATLDWDKARLTLASNRRMRMIQNK